ncbi:L,D-transpeptidase [Kutzneria sp. CA-103260]|uniref:L,D-transpeptidase n=1 Tax=Kutzneria sp. CA-103260 TaxID=2802641 RepID=UPI001BF0F140|nr:L,D-transpeptidase [Kutzneria sp. CA-103260]QUQ69142.1 murein L,D-transpeptidase [Kutzneria sp. CA-103260]
MRVNKIALALAAVGATTLMTACSTGVDLASDASPASTSASATTTTTTTTTVAPTTTTTTPPPTTTTTTVRPTTTTKPKPVGKAPGTPCLATMAACVDKSSGQAWLIIDGKVSYGPVPMMPGKASEPTPNGFFHVEWKDKHHKSSEFNNAPMENSVFFAAGGIAFHEGSLSRPSAGCVHLSMTASAKFYATLDVGDPVEVVA